jgi:predicted lysophospholipase L1 biosynthesis ABC-type transport system permease subunit
MAELPEGNSLTAGRWFAAQDAGVPQFSVEQGLADTLKLKLNDVLAYDIAGRRLEAKITSLRKLDWDSMRVNFFVVTPPGVLEPFPTSYITSFHLPQDKEGFVGELVAALSQPDGDRRRFHPAPVPVGDGPAGAGGAVRLRLFADCRAGRAVRRAGIHP